MAAISVIVPIYKVEAFLHRCVDSILAQTFADFDLVLVDDGSPDSCGDICEEYAGKTVESMSFIRKTAAFPPPGIRALIGRRPTAAAGGWPSWTATTGCIRISCCGCTRWFRKRGACSVPAGYFRTGGGDFPAMGAPEYRVLSADDYYCPDEAGEDVPAIAWNKLYHKSLFDTLRYP